MVVICDEMTNWQPCCNQRFSDKMKACDKASDYQRQAEHLGREYAIAVMSAKTKKVLHLSVSGSQYGKCNEMTPEMLEREPHRSSCGSVAYRGCEPRCPSFIMSEYDREASNVSL